MKRSELNTIELAVESEVIQGIENPRKDPGGVPLLENVDTHKRREEEPF
jgi:hypothetical protein